jgi:hypothetical protein
VPVVEVIRPDRQARRQRGKSDAADAVAAALAALNGEASDVPKSRDGAAESIRMLRVARAVAVIRPIRAGFGAEGWHGSDEFRPYRRSQRLARHFAGTEAVT